MIQNLIKPIGRLEFETNAGQFKKSSNWVNLSYACEQWRSILLEWGEI